MRRASVIWGLAAVVTGGAVALVVALPQLMAGRVATALAARATSETGMQVVLDGPVAAAWWPRPQIRAGAVAVASPDGETILRAESIEVEFGWPGLRRGQIDIVRLNLGQVRLTPTPSLPPFDLEARAEGIETRLAATAPWGTARLAVRRAANAILIEALTLQAPPFAAAGEGRLLIETPTRLVLRLDRVTRDGAPVGGVAFAGSYGRDGLLVERATLRRPDGAELSLFGHAVVESGSLRIEGGLEAAAPASGAEAAARLAGTVDKAELHLAITDIDGRAGGGRLAGTASLRAGGRSRLVADLRIDRMDVASGADLLLAAMAPFAMVDEAELRLRAGRLAVGAHGAEGVIADIAGQDGSFELRELAIRDLGGAPLRAVGSFTLGPGATIDATKLNVRYGAVAGTGRAMIDLSAARPRIRAEFATDELPLEPVFALPPTLPPEPMTRRAAAAAAAARRSPVPAGWSREAFTLPFLPPVDAELVITALRASLRGQRVDNARLAVRLAGDGVDLDELSGTTYGGQLSVKGHLDIAPRPSFRGTAALTGADLRAVLIGLAGVDALTGRADLVADLAAAGDNAAELVRTLEGTVLLTGRDGAVTGFDLPAVADRLKRISRPADLFELARAGSGGRTSFQTLDGRFAIARGVARTDGVRLVARGGEAKLRGSIDLPSWTLDLVNELSVTDPPGLPPLALRLNGSIAAPRSIFEIERLQGELMRRFRAPASR